VITKNYNALVTKISNNTKKVSQKSTGHLDLGQKGGFIYEEFKLEDSEKLKKNWP